MFFKSLLLAPTLSVSLTVTLHARCLYIYIYLCLSLLLYLSFIFSSQCDCYFCVPLIKNTDYHLKNRQPTTGEVLWDRHEAFGVYPKRFDLSITPLIIQKTVISRSYPNVWENGGAEQYIKPLDTVISLAMLAYVTSLRGWKPFIFMAGFIKTPRAHEAVVVVAKNFFPLHKTRL